MHSIYGAVRLLLFPCFLPAPVPLDALVSFPVLGSFLSFDRPCAMFFLSVLYPPKVG